MIPLLVSAFVVVFSIGIPPAYAGSLEELFTAAGEYYERGEYERAAAKYEQIATEGHASPALYYNLGNAYFRLGNRGKSILWYERARLMEPRDPDIRHNLELARSELEDGEVSIWEHLDLVLTPRGLGWLVTALFWLLCVAAGLMLWIESSLQRWRLHLLSVLAVLLISAAWLYGRMRDLNAPWGVIVQSTAEIRSGPGEQFAVGFTVPSGQRVLLLNRRGGWIEIGVPSRSLKGWATESSAESIRAFDD